ncbi:MAG: SHD1 domain-containing protein [Planctomycetota bacterium]|jgi:hypothetical protein
MIRLLIVGILVAGTASTPAAERLWTDSTGKYHIEAELVGRVGDKVRLKQKDGQLIEVPVEKLSEADRRYVASLGGQQATPPKPLTGRQKVEQALQAPTDFDFVETPLEEVADYLTNLHGIAVVLDRLSLRDWGVEPDAPVTAKGKGLPLEKALDSILGPLELAWFVRGDLLLISTAHEAEFNIETCVYKLIKPAADPEALVADVTRNVAPDSWEHVGGAGSIAVWPGGALVVAQSDPLHREIRRRYADRLQRVESVDGPAVRHAARGKLRLPEALYAVGTYEFDATPLQEAVRQLSGRTNVEIRIDRKAFAEVGVPLDYPITMRSRSVRGESVLWRILRQSSMTWTVDGEGLCITTWETAENQPLEIEYDVGGLVTAARGKIEVLVDVIETTTSPDTWQLVGGPGTIAVAPPDRLRIAQTPEVHREIGRLLDDLCQLRPKVTVSKETTFFTAPVRPDGYVDYVAALNKLSSEGVTPETNAAVLLVEAIGPEEMTAETREAFFRLLGVSPPTGEGPYFLRFRDYVATLVPEATDGEKPPTNPLHERIRDRLWYSSEFQGPWSEQELEILEAWLERNEEPLRRVAAACERDQYYQPLVSAKEPLVDNALLPIDGVARHIGRALKARAVCRGKRGRVDEAWEDVMTCYRLARLTGQGPCLVNLLVAIAVDSDASDAAIMLATDGGLTPQQAKRFCRELHAFPPMPEPARAFNLGERCMQLDIACEVARRGPWVIDEVFGNEKDPVLLRLINDQTLDLDQALMVINGWYDQVVAAAQKPTYAERLQARNELDARLSAMKEEAEDANWRRALLAPALVKREESGRRIGQMFLVMFTPATSLACREAAVTEAEFRLAKAAMALAAHHADRGAYPARLAQLAPTYLPQVPRDVFTNREIRYRRAPGGYELYSVGPDGQDGGSDDLVIRVPAE